jgi:hypothetical protein
MVIQSPEILPKHTINFLTKVFPLQENVFASLLTYPGTLTNGQILKNLEVPREVTESFSSKFADAQNPLIQLKGMCAN